MFRSLFNYFVLHLTKLKINRKVSKIHFGSLLRLVLPQMRSKKRVSRGESFRRLYKKQAHIFEPSRGGRVILFLQGEHNFKIQLPLYFQQPDWLSWSFPSNLKILSFGFRCASVVFWFISLTVRSTNNWQIENRNKHGEIWIKTANIGDFMEQNKAIKDTIQQRCW